ncbi:hypothetical protein HY772_01805 [Candidatus Woesearchaeota archaeon]|nr:hypothetical protein [Candidatus Woesearchaeota archaeon]
MSSKRDLSELDCLNDLEIILQEELLIDLTGKSPADLRKDLLEESKKIYFLYEIVNYLRGSYNDEGVRRWFQRERSQLEGKSPLRYLYSGWDPDDEEAKHVLELAKSLSECPH